MGSRRRWDQIVSLGAICLLLVFEITGWAVDIGAEEQKGEG